MFVYYHIFRDSYVACTSLSQFVCFLFSVEEAPLLWSHFVLQAAVPWKRKLEQRVEYPTVELI